MRIVGWIAIFAAFSLLTACSSNKGGKYFEDDGPPGVFSLSKMDMRDATPVVEKPIAATNKPYTVMGKRYYPVTGDKSMVQIGYGSWYGKKFHGKKTSSGEVYDMYKMTAAHKTMELPSYAKVTNLENGRSAIVRVNDRGPFLHNRIIDLSYAAATKLGYAGKGTAILKVESITREQIAKGEWDNDSAVRKTLLAAAPVIVPILKSNSKTATAAETVQTISEASESDLADQAISRLIQEKKEPTPILTAETISVSEEKAPDQNNKSEVKYIEEGVFVMADGSSGVGKVEKVVHKAEASGYSVQLGVFKSQPNAENLKKKIESVLKENTLPTAKIVGKDGLYRVLVGGNFQHDAAKELSLQLKDLLHQNAVVVKDMN